MVLQRIPSSPATLLSLPSRLRRSASYLYPLPAWQTLPRSYHPRFHAPAIAQEKIRMADTPALLPPSVPCPGHRTRRENSYKNVEKGSLHPSSAGRCFRNLGSRFAIVAHLVVSLQHGMVSLTIGSGKRDLRQVFPHQVSPRPLRTPTSAPSGALSCSQPYRGFCEPLCEYITQGRASRLALESWRSSGGWVHL
jgi:hypothetical protein